MAQYQTEAIVVAVRDWGEADKIVTLFSREHGIISAFANGARRPRSPLAGGMQLFTHLEVTLTAGKNSDTIKQCEIKQGFRKLQEDFNGMVYGTFIAELTAEICPERQPEPRIFDLLLIVLQLMTVRNPRITALAWAWQLLALSGYQPEFERCTVCGHDLELPAYFHPGSGGAVCRLCANGQELVLTEKMRDFINALTQLDWENPPALSVTSAALLQAEQVLLYYLQHCLERPLKSMAFIKQVSGIM